MAECAHDFQLTIRHRIRLLQYSIGTLTLCVEAGILHAKRGGVLPAEGLVGLHGGGGLVAGPGCTASHGRPAPTANRRQAGGAGGGDGTALGGCLGGDGRQQAPVRLPW